MNIFMIFYTFYSFTKIYLVVFLHLWIKETMFKDVLWNCQFNLYAYTVRKLTADAIATKFSTMSLFVMKLYVT